LHRGSTLALVAGRADAGRDQSRSRRGLAQPGRDAGLELADPVEDGALTGQQRAVLAVRETRVDRRRAVAPEPGEQLAEAGGNAGEDGAETDPDRAARARLLHAFGHLRRARGSPDPGGDPLGDLVDAVEAVQDPAL